MAVPARADLVPGDRQFAPQAHDVLDRGREAGTDSSVLHVLEAVCVGGAWWTQCRCGVLQAGRMTSCPVEDALAECVGAIERAYRISEREQGELVRASLHSVPVNTVFAVGEQR